MDIFIDILIILAIICLFILVAFLAFKLRKKKNKNSIKIDEVFISILLENLGGRSNLVKYSQDNQRVKFEVKDVSLCNLEGLKEMSPRGVFITNNAIKTLFKYESSLIIKMLDKKLK